MVYRDFTNKMATKHNVMVCEHLSYTKGVPKCEINCEYNVCKASL